MAEAISLWEFYSTYFKPLRLRSKRPRTKSLYETSIRTFAKFLGRKPMLRDLNNDTVNRHLAWYRDQGRAPGSVNKEHANLTAMWRYAFHRKMLDEWPDVEREVDPRKIPLAWLEHEIQAIFAAVDSEPGMFCGVPRAIWWRALLLVIWDTGERISAVSGLHWADIDLRTGWVIVSSELRKGNRADKAFKLAPDTIATLKQVKRHCRDNRVFPWPYTPSYLWTKYDEILIKAGLPTDRKSKFHRVRRSVASYFEAAGGDATQLLDHSDRRVTVKSYLDPRIVSQKQASDVLFRPNAPKAG